MRAPDGIALMREAQYAIRQAEDGVSVALQDFQKIILEELRLSYAQLLELQGSNISASVGNMQQIEQIRRRIDILLNSQQYRQIVANATRAYSDVRNAVTAYFALIAPDFAVSEAFASETLAFYRNQTIELLAGEGVNVNFKAKLERIILDGIQNGTPLKSLEASTREFLVKDGGDLARYAKQVTTDTLNTFSRAYTNGIADDLGLKHYFYSGTEIKTTRHFCDSRIGKYYTKEEVEEWAGIKWDGKKKGTNKETIFVYLGGYNCRHKLIPVTETMYNRNK